MTTAPRLDLPRGSSTFFDVDVTTIVNSVMTPENSGLDRAKVLQQCGLKAFKQLEAVPTEKLALIDEIFKKIR